MSAKFFVFNRTLPPPFDMVGKKVKVSSQYGSGTEATLSSTVVKAVLAYCRCRDGSGAGAKCVAEYKSSSGASNFHLAVYDPSSGAVLASRYDNSTELMETYTARSTAQDGAAILMAMFPALMEDMESRTEAAECGA